MIIPNIWKNKNHVPNHQPVMLEAMGFYSEMSGLFKYMGLLLLSFNIWNKYPINMVFQYMVYFTPL